MKYTPGPWKAGEAMIYSPESSIIATCHVSKNYDEMKANTHLIAAAPELLEACKEALEALHNLMPNERMKKANCWNPSEYEKCPCTSCKLKRVIAKAEGKEL